MGSIPNPLLFSMMTKAQDKVVLGFLIHGVNLILNKGMTGIWIARRYWLFFYIEEPIYPSVYHVFWGGGKTISYNLLFLLLVRILFRCIVCPFWSYFFSFLVVSDTFLAPSSTFFYIVWNIIGIYMHDRYGSATETNDFTTYSDILIRDIYTAVIINFS